MKYPILLVLLLWCALPLGAQDDDVPVSAFIEFDDVVTETITETAFWDWWQIQASEGDIIVADMIAEDQLEPLLGILGPNGDLLDRSEDGLSGGSVTLEYTIPETGEYTIVTTRAGNENGTSTGPYTLQVRRANPVNQRVNPYQQVEFRCQDFLVTNVVTLEFEEDLEQAQYYLISVYGYGDFKPVIRANLSVLDFEDCASDSQGMAGTVYTVPGEETVTLEGETPSASQLIVGSAAQAGTMTLTIGSMDGAPGRYVAVIDGFVIGEEDTDTISIGQGPLAAPEPLTVYMIGGRNERLDPSMRLLTDPADDEGLMCDDAGRRGCEGVPSPVGISIQIAQDQIQIEADPFDAGIVLPARSPQLHTLELSSFRGNTTGRYSLVLLGELPE